MNPTQAFANRTARMLAEGAHKDRLAYSTETPKEREHVYVTEVEHRDGYRMWVSPEAADDLVENGDYEYSDHDHSAKCWCVTD